MKLPGSAADKPNIYTFNTTYQQMYDDLLRKDYNLYPEKSISRGKKFSSCLRCERDKVVSSQILYYTQPDERGGFFSNLL